MTPFPPWDNIVYRRPLKFGHSEKKTKFEKIFHLKFDATQCQLKPHLSCKQFLKWNPISWITLMHVYSLIRFATLQLGCRVVPGLQNLQLVSKLGWLKCAPRWALMWAKKCKKIWLLLDAKLFHYGQFVKINLFKVCNLTLKNLGFWEVFFLWNFIFSELCIFQIKITSFFMKDEMFS